MSVGIDIGSKTIKICELTRDGSGWKLRASGVVGYKSDSPDKITDDKEKSIVAGIIKKLHREAKISSKSVNISIPQTQIFTRIIKFPPLTDSEIASAVKWEAEQYIPMPVNEAVIEHKIIERKTNTTPEEVLVLIVAAPKELVQKYVDVIHEAGLNPYSVEPDLMAIVRSLAPNNKTVVIVDFGARSTNIAISRNSELYFTRSVPTAGEAFTRAVAQYLNIEHSQAEEYKKTYGLSNRQLEGKIRSAIDPVFKMLTDEIKKAIAYYQSEEKLDIPNSVIISGGTSGMPDLVVSLSDMLNMEVIIGNPFIKVSIDPKISQNLSGFAPIYSVSVGLAMRED